MMQLFLTPQARFDTLAVHVSGDVLTLNGVALDFAQLTEGAALPRKAIACDWIAGDVRRIDGVLQVPLLLPLGPDASEAARFPEPINVATDGSVELPQ